MDSVFPLLIQRRNRSGSAPMKKDCAHDSTPRCGSQIKRGLRSLLRLKLLIFLGVDGANQLHRWIVSGSRVYAPPMDPTTPSACAVLRYRFGPYEADLLRGELRKFGLRIRLEPKPWHLLVVFLQRPGELIMRTELQRALWGEDVFVEFDRGLNVAMTKLRSALSDPVNAPRYIETVAGEGYRFLAHVQLAHLGDHSAEQQIPTNILTTQKSGSLGRWTAFYTLAVIGMIIFSLIGLKLIGRSAGAVRNRSSMAQIRRFVYVPDYSGNAVLGYSVNPNTGELGPVSTSPFKSGEHPYYAAFTPDRDFLYVANRGRADGLCGDGCNISAYAVDPVNGGLIELEGSPFSAGSGPVALATHPSGKFLYVANVISNDLQAYARNADGGLKRIGAPVRVGTHPFYVAITPSGSFLYVTNQDDATISAFSVDPGGELHQVAGSPFASGLRPRSFTIHPSGRFAYVVNFGVNPYISHDAACSGNYGTGRGKGCTISVFSIDQQTGSLSEIKGSPFESDGTNPVSSEIDSQGKYLFVANTSSNNVSVFRVDGTNGEIKSIQGSPFPAPYGPAAIALDWSSEYVYVVSAFFPSVSQFAIDSDSGRLRTIGPPLQAGVGPVAIAAPRGSPD
jgi:6-phosphogluconolactonase (cycloisomerase 2 family)/DNA-binding winged helix-turn-helix (wHTH) protein